MASGNAGSETRTDTAVPPRYSRYLAGYLALTVLGTLALLVLAKHSSHLVAAVEVLVAGGVLAAASAGAVVALYRDAVEIAGAETRWRPNWKLYVAFVVGQPVQRGLADPARRPAPAGPVVAVDRAAVAGDPSVGVGKNGTIVECVSCSGN